MLGRRYTVIVRNFSTVGFVGLGQMGGGMAQNLIRKGEDLVVYDVNEQHSLKFGKKARSLSELASECSTIITMLPDGPTVENIYSGTNGIFHHARRGAKFIDCSTIEPSIAQSLSAKASNNGFAFIDAPVSGGIKGAHNGTLSFMVGGRPEDCNLHRELLKKMGKAVIYCGTAGSGQVAKICNNLLLAISMAGLCEALTLGKRLGLKPEILSEIINSSSGRCWSSEMNNPVPGLPASGPSSNNYIGGFSTKLLCKDLGIALKEAKEVGFKPRIGSETEKLFQELLSSELFATKDFSSLYQYLQTIR